MELDRRIVTILRTASKSVEEPARISKADALAFMWELTEEVYSLSGKYNVKSRLQRDVITIIKR